MMRSKGWLLAIIFVLFLYFCFSSINAIARSRSPRHNNDIVVQPNNPYRRLNTTLLTSALAHILAGYVANRTPDIDTPPLLVLYSCKQGNACGSLEERLTGITSAYVFSMLWDGAAFSVDMDAPFKFDWYFQSNPWYMSLRPGQVNRYLDDTDPAAILDVDTMTADELSTVNFMDKYRAEGVRILRCGRWDSWQSLLSNPSVKRYRDKYQLQQLSKSEGFWLVQQMLFRRPSDWLISHLASYKDLMGGELYYDPIVQRPLQSDNVLYRWLRVGVHLATSLDDEVDCIAGKVAYVCSRAQVMGKECHVFLSAPSKDIIHVLQNAIRKRGRNYPRFVIHAVSESYEFTPDSSMTAGSFPESDEQRAKMLYARPIMDWIILSRMDYLIGSYGDQFLQVAGWAAQVQTDLYYSGAGEECKIESMDTW
ncbi:hypothetical protein BJV82DRAFT_590448 [Fennellomyces sp. T-0311]|nr:hypothetical protein BJV82DRAFT_590448 [Fennellomyces sp. T-0311]